MKAIKEIVKKRILEMGISSDEFSKRVGFTPQYLNKIYTKNSTTIDTLEKMAEVLGINVGDFFDSVAKVEEPPADYIVIKKDELIELQKMALGNMKRELEVSKIIEMGTK